MALHEHVHEYLRSGQTVSHPGAGHLPLGFLPVGSSFSPSGTKLATVPTITGSPPPIVSFLHKGPIGQAACGLLPAGPARDACLAVTSPGVPTGQGIVGPTGCPPLMFFNAATGKCELDLIPGPGGGGVGSIRSFGPAVMGFYGAAIEPGTLPISRRTCPRGTVLGKDGLCYNKISNSDRMWPKGRAPLLTGGDLNAITRAKRASTKIQNKVRDLQGMGMLPTKTPSRRRKKAAPIALPPSGHSHLLLSGG